MTRLLTLALAAFVALPLAASAQIADAGQPVADADTAVRATADDTTDDASAPETDNPLVQYPNQRPPDFRGLNTFEAPKTQAVLRGDTPELRIGAAFAQQFQALDHSNTAAPNMVDGVNTNELVEIDPGFNLATANLTANALLADGIQVNLDVYLSSRHHAETWVKGGYVQIDDASFLGSELIDRIMEYTTVKIGHYEVNYGDAHFRRTDNGNTLYNPFIENNILDAFATEIGGEVYVRGGGALAMLGVTNGEIRGAISDLDERSFSVYGKLGVDRQVSDDLRLRLTGSTYHNGNAARNTLYGGDRTGSRYYDVLVSEPGASFTNGRINPGFTETVTSVMVNPFVKFRGLELFGTLERSSGHAASEAEARTWTQLAGDVVYRFLPREQAYVGARYNRAEGTLAGMAADVSSDRYELAAGWFPTRNLLLKVAYVDQQYHDFPTTNILNGGQFNGLMVEAGVAF